MEIKWKVSKLDQQKITLFDERVLAVKAVIQPTENAPRNSDAAYLEPVQAY